MCVCGGGGGWMGACVCGLVGACVFLCACVCMCVRAWVSLWRVHSFPHLHAFACKKNKRKCRIHLLLRRGEKTKSIGQDFHKSRDSERVVKTMKLPTL